MPEEDEWWQPRVSTQKEQKERKRQTTADPNLRIGTPHLGAQMQIDEQHGCMGWYSHGVSKVSVRDAAGVKQVEQW